MDITQITPIIIKLNIVIESLLFLSYCLAYYLTAISSIRNGLNRGLSATFLSGILYTLIWIIYLIILGNNEIITDDSTIYVFTFFGIARLVALVSRFYLMHELREYVSKRKRIK